MGPFEKLVEDQVKLTEARTPQVPYVYFDDMTGGPPGWVLRYTSRTSQEHLDEPLDADNPKNSNEARREAAKYLRVSVNTIRIAGFSSSY